ncbi:MAG: hypothetical protein QOF57_1630 [Frankiaceae bacterium]|nr:hypothetical protein [Frankiaceae bacterium]
MSFEQLVEDYRSGNPSSQVRSPDMRDVVKRAHRHRRRQVASGVLSVAIVVTAGSVATQTIAHNGAVPPAEPTLQLVAADLVGTAPHFVGETTVDLPVTYGVAGRDALWLVGKKGDAGWQLMKIGAPDVKVTVRVTVPSEPIGVAATQRYVWVGVNGADGPQLLQYGADGSAIHVYPLTAPPVAVHGVDSGTAWVTETVAGGVQVARFDGDKLLAGATSKLIPGTPGTPATVMGGDKIFVHTRVGDQTHLAAISSRTLAPLPKWSLDFGTSAVRDIAFTDPLYFAATDGPQQGFWEAPLVQKTGYPAMKATAITSLPTYKVSTTNEHAWALSAGPAGTVLQRYDRHSGTIGASISTKVAADTVSVMVVDLNYIWLVSGDKISVFGPS